MVRCVLDTGCRRGWNLLEMLWAPPDGLMSRIADPESAPAC